MATPSAPVLLGAVATNNQPRSVAVSGPTAYVVNDGSNTLQVFDFPASPRTVAVNPGGSFASVSMPGSNDFVRNQTTPQAANFNISGTGTVGGPRTVGESATVGGSATVGSSLTVGANVQVPAASNYTYAAAKPYTLMLGAADFSAETTAGNGFYTADDDLDSSTNTNIFRAPLHLPQGAISTGITLLAHATNPANNGNLQTQLLTYEPANFATSNSVVVATVITTGSTGYQTLNFGVVAVAVDNTITVYSVRANFGITNSGSLRLRGVKVNYTVLQAD